MTHCHELQRFGPRLFALADELGNVRAAGRTLRLHPSTYDRRRKAVQRWGLDAPRPRAKRPGRIAGSQAPPERRPQIAAPVWRIEAGHPSDLVQLDCFDVGQLAGSHGPTRQDTAIDVASSCSWATLRNTPRNRAARYTAALVEQGARELALRGRQLDPVSIDNAGEFTSATFTAALSPVLQPRTRPHPAPDPEPHPPPKSWELPTCGRSGRRDECYPSLRLGNRTR